MRICKLSLFEFGCFRDRVLEFPHNVSFHLLYGANEAGKSTALRALVQLLYGIPVRSAPIFAKVGAEIEFADGKRLTLTRRRGYKNTLLDEAGHPLEQNVFGSLLVALRERDFCLMFGLSHETLREGGRALLEVGGAAGESLFSAATGIACVHKVLNSLKEEARELFAPRASNPRLNRAIGEYKEKREQARKKAVPPADWEKFDNKLSEAERRKASLWKVLDELRQEESKLERIRRVLPLIAKRTEMLRQLKEFEPAGDIPLLPRSAREERIKAQEKLRSARQGLERARKEKESKEAEMSRLVVPQDLLTVREQITELFQGIAKYRSAKKDLPEVEAEYAQKKKRSENLLRELAPGVSLAEVERLRIPVTAKEAVRTLIKRYPVLKQKEEDVAEMIDGLKLKEKQIEKELGALQPKDFVDLEEAVAQATREGRVEEELRKTESEITVRQKEADVRLKALGLWKGTLAGLEALGVPDLETVNRFDTEIRENENELKSIKQRLDEEEGRLANANTGLEKIKRITGEVPTLEKLQEARDRRQWGWGLILRAWIHQNPDREAEKVFALGEPLHVAYEKSVRFADEIGDRLREKATEAAEKASLLALKEESARKITGLREQQQALLAEREALHREWQKIWSALGIEPLPPAEMRSWLGKRSELLQLSKELRGLAERRREVQGRVSELQSILCAALIRLGVPAASNEPLSSLLGKGTKVLEDLKREAERRERLQEKLREVKKELAVAEQKREEVSWALDRWRIDWMDKMKRIGLPPETLPDVAEAFLNKTEELFQIVEGLPAQETRINRLKSYLEGYTAEVADLLRRVKMPELDGLPPDHAVLRLHDELRDALANRQKLVQLEQQVKDRQEEIENRRREICDAEAELERLKNQARCHRLAELEEQEERSFRFQELQGGLKGCEEQILSHGAGLTLEEILKEAEAVDPDEVSAKLRRTKEEIKLREKDQEILNQEIGSLKAKKERIDGRAEAAAAAEEAEHLLAEIGTLTSRYLCLHLAATLLEQGIERYRQNHQAPVLRRASELFSRLTLGSFKELTVGFDKDDQPVLMGLRPTGEEVNVEAMSDGARDQLFLALRLASLEDYLKNNEPMPLVVDDALVNFDDERAHVALEVLGELAAKTQILFFTHHRHLVSLAAKTLPGEILQCHRL